MNTDDLEPEELSTDQRIMEVTYHALCEHGYAGLSMQRIADALDMSKASIYYHYDSKDEMLLSLLDYATEYFIDELQKEMSDDARQNVLTLMDRLVPDDPGDEEREGMIAMFELRSRAGVEEVYRAKFTEVDRVAIDLLHSVLEEGVSSGQLRETDTRGRAEHIYSRLVGARVLSLTTDNEQLIATTKAEIRKEIESLDT
jgi:AcrR family transcriptional regulator